MIERPFQGPMPGPAGTDLLSDTLQLFHLKGAMLLRGEFSAPWAIDAPASPAVAGLLYPGERRQLVIFHIVARGECWVEVEGAGREHLSAGDVVMLPHGDAHAMWHGQHARRVPVGSLFPPPPWTELPVLHHGGGGAHTRIVCAYLSCERLLFNPFLTGLPRMLCVRPGGHPGLDWFRASVRYLGEEASDAGPGAACLASRMTELLFIEILRLYVAESSATDWLMALGDRNLSLALRAIHEQPHRPWSLNTLAQASGLSRSALTARFRRCLGRSPIQYLMLWRLQLAAQRLQHSDEKLASIAEQVGYGSEEAFSRAFKRCTGVSPAHWRSEPNVRRGSVRIQPRVKDM